MSAALTLNDAGLASTVYEASNRVGGRMHSDTSGYWQNGQTSEWCGELIDTGHETILALADRFGLTTVNLPDAPAPSGAHRHVLLRDRSLPRSTRRRPTLCPGGRQPTTQRHTDAGRLSPTT